VRNPFASRFAPALECMLQLPYSCASRPRHRQGMTDAGRHAAWMSSRASAVAYAFRIKRSQFHQETPRCRI
jgi:hypothetical protein